MGKNVKKVSRRFNGVEKKRSRLELKKESSSEETDDSISSGSEQNEEENISNDEEVDVNDSEDNHGSDDSKSEKNRSSVGMSDNDEREAVKSEEEGETIRAPKRKRKRRKRMEYDPAEEARLERLVFGDPSDVLCNLADRPELPKDNAKITVGLPSSFQDSDDSDFEPCIKSDSEDDLVTPSGKQKVAWVDENDVHYTVRAALKAQHHKLPKGIPEKTWTELLENKFTRIVGTPKWARIDAKPDDSDADTEDEILKHSNHLAVSKIKKLRKGTIDIKALKDINKATGTEGPITTSLEFHPTSTVAMVAGLSGVLSLFQVDGRENTKLQSICFDKFGINCAKFLRDGSEVILGSRDHAFGHVYDLMSGKTYKIPLPHGVTNMKSFEVSPNGKLIAIIGRMGQIYLVSSATKELVATFKMNEKCLALAFSPGSDKLFSHGEGEQVYIWDLQNHSCLHKATDDGCIAGSAVAFSPSGQFLATGSKQGVVNVYDTNTMMLKTKPEPVKIILNLVTPITKLKFNPTSEILAMASNHKENAFRMLHIPSFTVFSNFPTFQTKMYNPREIDFSPSSGYLGLSNDKGRAYLYRLKHYGNY